MENLKVEAASSVIARASPIMSSPKQIATVMVGTKRAVWFQSLFPGPSAHFTRPRDWHCCPDCSSE
jgi:hypothetical protein